MGRWTRSTNGCSWSGYLSGRGVLLQPVVDLGHHRGVRRLHRAAQGEKTNAPFIHLGLFTRWNMGSKPSTTRFPASVVLFFFVLYLFCADRFRNSALSPICQEGKKNKATQLQVNKSSSNISHWRACTALGQQTLYLLFFLCPVRVWTCGLPSIVLPGLLSARTLESKQPLIGQRKTRQNIQKDGKKTDRRKEGKTIDETQTNKQTKLFN